MVWYVTKKGRQERGDQQLLITTCWSLLTHTTPTGHYVYRHISQSLTSQDWRGNSCAWGLQSLCPIAPLPPVERSPSIHVHRYVNVNTQCVCCPCTGLDWMDARLSIAVHSVLAVYSVLAVQSVLVLAVCSVLVLVVCSVLAVYSIRTLSSYPPP